MDKKGHKSKIVFWTFLLWVLFLPVLCQSIGQVRADVISGFDHADNEAEAVGMDDRFSDFDENLPPLSINPEELLASVESMVVAKQYSQLIRELRAHEDAVEESAELLHIYVDALMNAGEPDWKKINRYARFLGNQNRNSSLADYAKGMYYARKAKPDLKRAADYLKKAMSGKKPHPSASGAYYTVMAKRFWQIGLILVLLPIVVVAKIIKKKKDASLVVDLDFGSKSNMVQEAGVKADFNVADKEPDAEISDGDRQQNDAKYKPTKNSKKNKKSFSPKNDKLNATCTPPSGGTTIETMTVAQEPDQTLVDESSPDVTPTVPVESASEIVEAVTQTFDFAAEPSFTVCIKQAPLVATPVEPSPDTSEPEPSKSLAPEVSAARPQCNSNSDKFQAEIEEVRRLTQPQRRPPVEPDSQLDALWSSLCRKAMQERMAPQFRSKSEVSSARSGSNKGYNEENNSQVFDSSAYEDVSIDLSEEALKEDLVGKLKMLAISDNELRDLMAQKNPVHVPYLIEYVLTRPEPVRLSFVARELGNYKDTAVIDMLASLLYHDDDRVALAAIQGLAKAKSLGAVMHLCPFLKSETPLLAQAARTALSGFGAAKILQAFANLPQHPDTQIREAGVFVLSRMKGAKVEELLTAMLNDDSLDVRTKVILAMSYQKNPVYLESLRNFFRTAAESDKAMARKAIVYLQGFVDKKR